MEPEVQPASSRSRSIISGLAFGLIVVLVSAIVLVRGFAEEVDFAQANLATAGLVFLSWICLVVALFASPWSRSWWRIALAAPWVLLGGTLALFKIERLDGELIPQFRPRWAAEVELPTASLSATAAREAVEDPRFISRDTDFPQYLGKERDAIIADWLLADDWQSSPPEILWKQPIGNGWSGFAIQGDVAVTMELRDEEEWVTAYSVLDGQLLWHYAIEAFHTHVAGGAGPRATPTIANDRVFACSAVSQLVCLDFLTGDRIWSQDLLSLGGATQEQFEEQVAWGRAGSPLVVDGLVIVPFGGKSEDAQLIIAFKEESGEEMWRGGQGQISYASPMLAEIQGVPQILLTAEDHVASFSPATGAELWRIDWPGFSNANASVSQPIVLNSSHVFTSKGYSQGARLTKVTLVEDEWQTEVVWKNARVLRTKFTSCVVDGGYVYGLSDGILECVDLATGQRQWKRGRYRHGQLLLVGKHLLISAESGELVLVEARPDAFVELHRFAVIGDVTWNTLALSGDRLLMRNSDEVACVRLPLAGQPEAAASTAKESNQEQPGLNDGNVL